MDIMVFIILIITVTADTIIRSTQHRIIIMWRIIEEEEIRIILDLRLKEEITQRFGVIPDEAIHTAEQNLLVELIRIMFAQTQIPEEIIRPFEIRRIHETLGILL